MFFLCGGPLPACPNGAGTVTGTVTAANIIGPAGQGVAPGEFQEAIAAMRDGAAYANPSRLALKFLVCESAIANPPRIKAATPTTTEMKILAFIGEA